MRFEWDSIKARNNLQKHGVSFDEAITVFADVMALTFADSDHFESEDRSRTYGISNIRIISARRATRYEKSIYTQG